MTLMTNGSPMFARFLAGPLASLAPVRGPWARLLYANAAHFGDDTSWPQGFQSVLNAWVPPLVESGQAAAELRIDFSLLSVPDAFGQASASLTLDFDMTAAVNNLASAYATLTFSMDMTAEPIGVAQAAATLDWIARPSANDIAQEVWNSFSIEGGFSGADVMRIVLAALAGKVSGAETSTVTIRDTQDTKDRVVASVDADGNRSTVVLDGSP